jgi:hypothetical protein
MLTHYLKKQKETNSHNKKHTKNCKYVITLAQTPQELKEKQLQDNKIYRSLSLTKEKV